MINSSQTLPPFLRLQRLPNRRLLNFCIYFESISKGGRILPSFIDRLHLFLRVISFGFLCTDPSFARDFVMVIRRFDLEIGNRSHYPSQIRHALSKVANTPSHLPMKMAECLTPGCTVKTWDKGDSISSWYFYKSTYFLSSPDHL